MRRLVLPALAFLAALSLTPAAPAAPAKPPWAKKQIAAVVEAGLLAPSAAAFRPDDPLTQAELADALAKLAETAETPPPTTYVAKQPAQPVTIRELDAALVSFVGLTAPALAVTAALRDGGLAPKKGTGTETVARLLGFRLNHPQGQDALELAAGDPATRAEAAYSFARLLELSAWDADRVVQAVETLAIPVLTDLQREILTRAVSFVGFPYIWGGTSERTQTLFGTTVPGGFDCSGFVWRVLKLQPFGDATALAGVLRGRTTYEMSGEVPLAQRIRKVTALQPGDVLFQGARGPKSKPAEVDHAGIYLGGGWFVHSSGNGVTLHPFDGWYRERFAWARRPLREAGLA